MITNTYSSVNVAITPDTSKALGEFGHTRYICITRWEEPHWENGAVIGTKVFFSLALVAENGAALPQQWPIYLTAGEADAISRLIKP